MDIRDSRSDDELLRLSLAGEESAFSTLYQRLKTPIFRYAFHMTGSQAAAEEITQEVFILLLRKGNKYHKSKGDVVAFAFGMARNLVRRVHKRERAYQELPDDATMQQAKAEPGDNELAAEMIRRQNASRIRNAIASLPQHYREAVVLCDLCELTYAEAASRLGCAVGTIRSRLNRAHVLLAQKLKPLAMSRVGLTAAGPEECLI